VRRADTREADADQAAAGLVPILGHVQRADLVRHRMPLLVVHRAVLDDDIAGLMLGEGSRRQDEGQRQHQWAKRLPDDRSHARVSDGFVFQGPGSRCGGRPRR
jgi:hypothetical protein